MNKSNRNSKGSADASAGDLTNQSANSGNTRVQSTVSKSKASRPPWWDARYMDEFIASWWEGLIHTRIERYGRRFLLSRYVIEALVDGEWEALVEEFRETHVARALIEASRIRDGFNPDGTLCLPENLWHGKPVRCRLQTMTISYSSALLFVRENVLVPAIKNSIPRCMSADLHTSIAMKLHGSLEGPEPPQELQVVGSSPVSIPSGYCLGDFPGVIRRK